MKEKITELAESHGYKLSDNVDKIIRAKKMIFGEELWRRCPCAATSTEKYCISDTCKKEIEQKGHCCCNLYLKA